jgi:dolichol-phosphate mannosyltransferase
MNDQPHLYLIVPALNEAENLERLTGAFRSLEKEFEEYRLQIILVDDGSSDGTGERARKLSEGLDFVLLSHAVNQGPGRAFATAFEYLETRLQPGDCAVTMEGDNTSRHDLLRQMLTRTREGYDVILASPYLYGGGILNTSPWRVFLSHIANAFVKEALGIHGIMTMSSFYRLYTGRALKELQSRYGGGIIERRGFESMIEMLMKMMYIGLTISEVPMVLDTSRRRGKSKMKIMKTIIGYLWLWKDKRRWQRQSRVAIEGEVLVNGIEPTRRT